MSLAKRLFISNPSNVLVVLMRITIMVSCLMNQFYFSERYSFILTNLGGDFPTTVPSSTSATGQLSERDISTIHKRRMQ